MEKSERDKVNGKEEIQNINQGPISSNQQIINQPQQQVLIQANQQQTILQNPQIQGYQFQPIIYPQQQIYAQPIVYTPVQPNLLVVNQPLPTLTPPRFYSLSPTSTVCCYCMQKVTTDVKEEFNFLTCCLCCLFFMLIPFAILQGNCSGGCGGCNCCCSCRSDECNCRCNCKCCYDGNHLCPKCGRVIGRFDSCKKHFC